MEFRSLDSMPRGTVDEVHKLQGQFAGPTVTEMPAPGCSRLPLSSTARLRMLYVLWTPGRHVYVQFVVPTARRHVAPPSSETSTPPTTPPPLSTALPAMVFENPAATVAPFAGDVIVEVGGVPSVLGGAGKRPGCRVCGWMLMSPSRFIVPCRMFGSGFAEPLSGELS